MGSKPSAKKRREIKRERKRKGKKKEGSSSDEQGVSTSEAVAQELAQATSTERDKPQSEPRPKQQQNQSSSAASSAQHTQTSRAHNDDEDPERTAEIDFEVEEVADISHVSAPISAQWKPTREQSKGDMTASSDTIRSIFLEEQLQMTMERMIGQLRHHVSTTSHPNKVYVSHAWPAVPEEQGVLFEKLIVLIDDLHAAGLEVVSPITSWRNPNTSFEDFVDDALQGCFAMLAVASPSFKAEFAREDSCIAHEINKASEKNIEIIPLVLIGGFAESVPGALASILGTSANTNVTYAKYMPAVLGRLLGLKPDSAGAQLAETHAKDLDGQVAAFSEHGLTQDDVERLRIWSESEASRVALRISVLKSNLTRQQRLKLDNGLRNSVSAVAQTATKKLRPGSQAHLPATDICLDNNQQLSAAYINFMSSPKTCLLLVGDASTLAMASDIIFSLQWSFFDAKQQLLPVRIDLNAVETPFNHVVEQTLWNSGYSEAELRAFEEGHPGLVLVFQNWRASKHASNLFVRNRLASWGSLEGTAPKVVFLVDRAELGSSQGSSSQPAGSSSVADHGPAASVLDARLLGAAQGEGTTSLLFVPADEAEDPHPEALQIANVVSLSTEAPTPLNDDTTMHEAAAPAIKEKPKPEAGTAAQGGLQSIDANALWIKSNAVVRQTYLAAREDLVRKQMNSQLVKLQSTLVKVANIRPASRRKGFISYSWPRDHRTQTALQRRLARLREDMRPAGLDVTLDIMDLKVGMDIENFMKSGIEGSAVAFLIGTGDYRRRVPEPSNQVKQEELSKAEVTNVGKEYCHIRARAYKGDILVFPMWFDRGEHVLPTAAFPKGFLDRPFKPVLDCSSYSIYLSNLPDLYTQIHGLTPEAFAGAAKDLEEWQKACAKFKDQLRAVERSMSGKAVWEWYFADLNRQEEEEKRYREQLTKFLAETPPDVLQELAGSRDSKAAALQGAVSSVRSKSDVISSEVGTYQQSLRQYVPVLAATEQSPKKKEDVFDLMEDVAKQLAERDAAERPLMMLLQGGTGSGKSAFLRFLEFSLWRQHDQDPTAPIPLYVPLANLTDPSGEAVVETLERCGLDDTGVQLLREEQQFVFLFDGFDEVGKPMNLYHTNKLSNWKGHVIVGARSQFLQSLPEYVSLFTTPKQPALFERYLQPFTDAQVDMFLQRFAPSPESFDKDWRTFRTYIDKLPGLRDLVATPFLLRMACLCMPLLAKGASMNADVLVEKGPLPRAVSRAQLYRNFVNMVASRELWRCACRRLVPPSVDLFDALSTFNQDLALAMFVNRTIQAKLKASQLGHETALKILVDGSPLKVVGSGMRVSFVHKSVMEYLAAVALLRDLLALPTHQQSTLANFGANCLLYEPVVVSFMADLLREDGTACSKLYGIIQDSRQDVSVADAASNAFTVLNSARFSFSRKDLSGAKLRRSDMRAALLHCTDLHGADLSHSLLAESCIAGANMTDCDMTGADFGQQPDLPGQKHNVSAVCVHPCTSSSLKVSTVSAGQEVVAWDGQVASDGTGEVELAETGRHQLPEAVPHGDKDRSLPLALSDNGEFMVTMPSPTQLKVEANPTTTGKRDEDGPVLTLPAEAIVNTTWPFRNSVVVGNTGSFVACVTKDNEVVLLRVKDRSIACKLHAYNELTKLNAGIHHKGEINFVTCRLSPDEKTLVIFLLPLSIYGYKDNTPPGSFYLVNTDNGKLTCVEEAHSKWIGNVEFLDGGKRLLTVGNDDRMCCWDLSSAKQEYTIDNIKSGQYRVDRVAVSKCSKYCVTTDSQHGWDWVHTSASSLWSLEKRQRIAVLGGHDVGMITSIAFSGDSSLVATGSGDKTICVYNVAEGKLLNVLRGHQGAVSHLAFLSNATVLSASGASVKIWALEKSTSVPPITYVPNATHFAANENAWTLALTEHYLVGTHNTSTGQLGVWDRRTGELLPSLRGEWVQGNATRGLAPTKDGKSLLVGVCSGACLPMPQLDVESSDAPKLLRNLDVPKITWPTHFHGNTMAISRDNSLLAVTTLWTTSLLYDLASGALLGRLDGHKHQHVWSVMISPSNKFVATSASDNKIVVFDSQTREAVHELESAGVQFGFNDRDDLVCVHSKEKTVSMFPSADKFAKRAMHKEFANVDKLSLIFTDGRARAVLAMVKGTTLTLHDVEDFGQLSRLDSFTSNLGRCTLDPSMTTLAANKDGLPGLEVWRLDNEGSTLQWVNRPSLTVDATTNLQGVRGLSHAGRQLMQQHGASL